MANNSWIAFNPKGNTIVVLSSGSPEAGIRAPLFSSLSAYQEVGHYRIVNPNTFNIHLGVGNDKTEAQNNAVPADAGNPRPAILVLANSVHILRFNLGAYFSSFSDQDGNVYITPGEGL